MTGPMLHAMLADELQRDRERELVRAGRRRAARATAEPPAPREPVTLRLSTVRDDAALLRLAALAERRPAPRGHHVVAEVEGEIVAALPLDGGKPYADPFRRTTHILPLLELRAEQVTGYPRRRRRWTVLRMISHPSR